MIDYADRQSDAWEFIFSWESSQASAGMWNEWDSHLYGRILSAEMLQSHITRPLANADRAANDVVNPLNLGLSLST